jgi:hypothetical protein
MEATLAADLVVGRGRSAKAHSERILGVSLLQQASGKSGLPGVYPTSGAQYGLRIRPLTGAARLPILRPAMNGLNYICGICPEIIR